MSEPFVVDRYLVCDEIGSGGMARVHLGRVLGAGGFSRVVAIKRVFGEVPDEELATMLIDEARIASRIRHPNVVTPLDVVRTNEHLLLVMEYVHGPSLSWLIRNHQTRGEGMPLAITLRVVLDMLAGLHAAHEAKSERGRPLELIHRDVSPHNVLVGDDGVARVADFGIAHAKGKLNQTEAGVIRGKLLYMAPEQLRGSPLDRRADVFAAGSVLWELLTMRRMRGGSFTGKPMHDVIDALVNATTEPPSRYAPCPPSVEDVVMKSLRTNREQRYDSALAMADALERAGPVATHKDVAAWLAGVASELLATRARLVGHVEAHSAAFDTSDSGGAERRTPRVSVRPPGSVNVLAATAPVTPTGILVDGPRPGAPSQFPNPLPPPPAPTNGGFARFGMVIASAVLFAGAIVLMVVVYAREARRRNADVRGREPAGSSAPPSTQTPLAHSATDDAPPPRASTSTSTSASPSSTPTSATAKPRAKGTAKQPARDCVPPYTIDDQGVRVPKRECFPEK